MKIKKVALALSLLSVLSTQVQANPAMGACIASASLGRSLYGISFTQVGNNRVQIRSHRGSWTCPTETTCSRQDFNTNLGIVNKNDLERLSPQMRNLSGTVVSVGYVGAAAAALVGSLFAIAGGMTLFLGGTATAASGVAPMLFGTTAAAGGVGALSASQLDTFNAGHQFRRADVEDCAKQSSEKTTLIRLTDANEYVETVRILRDLISDVNN